MKSRSRETQPHKARAHKRNPGRNSRSPAGAPIPAPILKKRVLLIDDDDSILAALGAALESEDFLVIPAHNGEEAIQKFWDAGCDIALVDLNMPIKDGWDTFEQLTSADPLLPIIILTGRPGQYPLATAAGVGALMEKPLDFPLLFNTMKELMAEPPRLRLERLTGGRPTTRYIGTAD